MTEPVKSSEGYPLVWGTPGPSPGPATSCKAVGVDEVLAIFHNRAYAIYDVGPLYDGCPMHFYEVRLKS